MEISNVDIYWMVSVNRKHPERREFANVQLTFELDRQLHTYMGKTTNPWCPERKPKKIPVSFRVRGTNWSTEREENMCIQLDVQIPAGTKVSMRGLTMKEMEKCNWRGEIVEFSPVEDWREFEKVDGVTVLI